MSDDSAGIRVRGLQKQFAKGPLAVAGVDIDVEPGEIYGFLGPNGAGKSTTVLMLTTLLPPTGGTATVAGHDIATEGAEVRRAIGAALQSVALDNYLTAREHLHLVAALHGMNRSVAADRADELLDRVGLSEAADRKVGGFSGGMKRRLDLALALVHSPQVLFLDEPTTGLDPQSRAALWSEVRRLANDDGATVFLTTQYLEEADVLADRVGIIHRGRIVAEGTPSSLKSSIGAPTVEAVPAEPADRAALAAVLEQFGEPTQSSPKGVAVRLPEGIDEVDIVAVVRAIDSAGIQIAQIKQHEASLDDVFLAKTGTSLEGSSGAGELDEPVPVGT